MGVVRRSQPADMVDLKTAQRVDVNPLLGYEPSSNGSIRRICARFRIYSRDWFIRMTERDTTDSTGQIPKRGQKSLCRYRNATVPPR